jgi:hypothetical protein
MPEPFRVNLCRTYDVKTANVGENVGDACENGGNVGENVGETTEKEVSVWERIMNLVLRI